jgi:Zn ribbon nucleic-acid-binding protein
VETGVGIVRPHRPAQTRQRFLAALLCPACAHDLKDIPARDDGVTVCPECGAAWRVEGTEGQRDEGTEGMGG